MLYPGHTASAPQWHLTPLQDQQLAGLVMWVPAGTVYAAAALMFAALWVRRSGEVWTLRLRSLRRKIFLLGRPVADCVLVLAPAGSGANAETAGSNRRFLDIAADRRMLPICLSLCYGSRLNC
jgi:hypothetical protein